MLRSRPRRAPERQDHGDDEVRPRATRPPCGGPPAAERRGPLHRRHRAARACCTASCCAARTPRRRIGRIDTAAAASLAGVKAIYTAADLKADGIGTLPCAAPVQNRDGSDQAMPPHPVLADGMVRHVGDPVAFIVADTAKAGARRGRSDRGRLRNPAVGHRYWRRRWTRARRWSGPRCKHNIVFDWEIGDKAATEAQFAKAAHVTRLTVVNNRIVVSSMEARAAMADFDAGDRALDAVCQHPGRLAGEEPDRRRCSAPIRRSSASSRPMSAAASA